MHQPTVPILAPQGPVARRSINTNPGWDFNPVFFLSKAFSWIIFCILFRVSNCQIVGKKNSTEFAFKLSYLNLNFALTLGYLSPALKNPAEFNHTSFCRSDNESYTHNIITHTIWGTYNPLPHYSMVVSVHNYCRLATKTTNSELTLIVFYNLKRTYWNGFRSSTGIESPLINNALSPASIPRWAKCCKKNQKSEK